MRASANSLTTVVPTGTPRTIPTTHFMVRNTFIFSSRTIPGAYLNQLPNAQSLCRGAISKACFPRNKKPSENWYLKHYKIFEKFIIGRGTKKSHRQTQTGSSAQRNIFSCFVNSNALFLLKIKRRLETHFIDRKNFNFL